MSARNARTVDEHGAASGCPSGLVLVLPALLFLAAFMVYPVANLHLSQLPRLFAASLGRCDWVGIDNYAVALTEPATYDFALDDRHLHRRQRRDRARARTAGRHAAGARDARVWRAGRQAAQPRLRGGFILPFAIPGVVAAVVWKMFLDPQIGPLDALIGSPIAWFAHYPLTDDHRHRRMEDDAVRDVPALRRDHVDRAAAVRSGEDRRRQPPGRNSGI